MRIDFGQPLAIDTLTVVYSDERPLDALVVEVSEDMRIWRAVSAAEKDGVVTISIPSGWPVRYVRTSESFEKVFDISGSFKGKPLDRSQWRCTNLFKHYAKNPAAATWSLKCTIDEAAKGSYLAVPIEGKHGLETGWAAIRMGDQLIGSIDRAVSFPSNPWEYRSARKDSNYTYYFPVTEDMIGQEIEIVVMALDAELTDLTPSAWITAYPIPMEEKELVLN